MLVVATFLMTPLPGTFFFLDRFGIGATKETQEGHPIEPKKKEIISSRMAKQGRI